jgi:hypothetical protein
MTRVDGFGKAVAFAALAAGATAVWLLLAVPAIGGRAAVDVAVVALGVTYLTVLRGSPRRILPVTALLLVLAGTVWPWMPSVGATALGMAAAIGVGQVLTAKEAGGVRVVVREAALLGSGLALAATFAAPSIRGIALAVWAFFLVQSFRFVLPASPHPPDVDPFDAAHARAVALLGGDPG